MSGSVTTVLCIAMVWATGFNDTTAAADGLKPQEAHQVKISRVVTPAIPEIVTDYVLIYKPQPDVYRGGDSKNYKSGEIYYKWQPNGARNGLADQK